MTSLPDTLAKIEESSQDTYRKGEVKVLLNNLNPQYIYYSVDKLYIGDVFMHKIVGGKVRPWVVMFNRRGLVGAATLTHDLNLAYSYKSECRFYKDSVIGPTLALFEEDRVLDCCLAPYTNKKHLSEVRKSLLGIWK